MKTIFNSDLYLSEGFINPLKGYVKAQAGINIARDDTTLMAQSEEELKSLLMKVKVESGKLA